ncbi:fimbrial protein [Dyella sp.]|uniref:fimbrial protein n=1 Tax=Dyella sp. TaxID=1869338 RepID=UPI002ED11BD8
MKRLCIALIASTLLASGAGQATDLTINFVGSFRQATCSFSVDPVYLGDYDQDDFTAVGYTTPRIDVPIMSNGCDSLITALTMTFTGTPDSTDGRHWALTPGGATGIAVSMATKPGLPIIVGRTYSSLVLPAGKTYDFVAFYTQVAPEVTPGAANSNVVINITYR